MGDNIGYVRVSKFEQNEALQRDALGKAGCKKIFADKGVSRLKFDRKGLDEALEYIRPGDCFVVWRLDRLGGSLQNLIEIVNDFHAHAIEFRSLTEGFDTTTAVGKLMFQITGAFAEYEVEIIRQRTRAGLESARMRGRIGGRPKFEADPKKIKLALDMYKSGEYTVERILEITKAFNSRTMFYKYIKKEENKNEAAQ